jgi:hypothetical protein
VWTAAKLHKAISGRAVGRRQPTRRPRSPSGRVQECAGADEEIAARISAERHAATALSNENRLML